MSDATNTEAPAPPTPAARTLAEAFQEYRARTMELLNHIHEMASEDIRTGRAEGTSLFQIEADIASAAKDPALQREPAAAAGRGERAFAVGWDRDDGTFYMNAVAFSEEYAASQAVVAAEFGHKNARVVTVRVTVLGEGEEAGESVDCRRYRLALESLTPGGSEYHCDPERCVTYVRERHEAEARQIRRLAGELRETHQQIDAAESAAAEARRELEAVRGERDRYRKAADALMDDDGHFLGHVVDQLRETGAPGMAKILAGCLDVARAALGAAGDAGRKPEDGR